MLKNGNRNGLRNRLRGKGLVFGVLVMLFVATMASVGIVIADKDEDGLLVSIKGYSPSLSPDWNKVAYFDHDEDSGTEQLWVMNTDGRGLKKLDEGDHITIEEWDPKGKKILYTIYIYKDEQPDRNDLWVVNSDGTGKKRIAGYVPKHSPVAHWSPDGSKIAFESEYFGEGICVVNSDGSNKTLITKDGSLRYWTPDGKKIIFLKYPKFWEIDLDSGILKNIYTGEFGIISPDRSKIASQNFHGGSGVWISNMDGSNLKELTYYIPSWYPCWSPDSTRIAFIDEGIRHGIWVINSNGSGQKKVKELSYEDIQRVEDLLWNQDGSKIAYAMRENKTTDIYTINVGGIEKPEIPIGEEGEKKGILGFEAVFAIAGLLVIAYLLRRRK